MKKTVLAAMAATCLVAFHPTASQAMNCVAYVRSVTSFDLSGNAYQWWGSAAGLYTRGHQPSPGAVMVFARTRGMPDGHVAVVREIRSSREILIDQANWVRGPHGGAVTKATSVVDVSPNNDWSQVRVEWLRTGSYGRVNPVSGFIYQDGDSRGAVITAQYLKNKSTTLAATEPCATEPGEASLGHAAQVETIAPVSRHQKAHVVTAVWHPAHGKHGVTLASVHIGNAKHHGATIAHVTSAVAARHAPVKLSRAVLVYNNKTQSKVMAGHGNSMKPTKIAQKTTVAAKKVSVKATGHVVSKAKPVAAHKTVTTAHKAKTKAS